MDQAITLTCPECGERFLRTHHLQLFCAPAHKKAFGNRQLSRAAVVQLGQVWRSARSSKDPGVKAAAKLAFALMCRRLDEANAEDRAAKRPRPEQVFMLRQAAGLI